jgi:alpha-tubulin suppressor-like RCC1 family protein
VLLSSGRVKCWGSNDYGQLGNGELGSGKERAAPVDVANLTDVVALAAGNDHTCALLSGGSVKCWGSNDYGQLGTGDSGSGKGQATPVAVSNLSGVLAVAAGEAHTCALLSGGGVKCWGYNSGGQLGNGKSGPGEDQAAPVAVSNLSGVTAVTAGKFHSCALLSSGSVKCWGENDHGQVGNGELGDGKYQSTPGNVSNLSGVAAVNARGRHSCALLVDGSVKCWGWNDWGQLGNGESGAGKDRATPVSVSNLSGVAAVVAGGYHNCALMGSGGIKCWGMGDSGQLGNGGTSDKSTPVDVIGLP